MKRIFTKIFLGYLTVILLLSGMILYFSFSSIKSHYINYLVDDLKNYSEILLSVVKPQIMQDDNSSLDTFVKETGREINTRITIIDLSGKVLADSRKDPSLMENH